MPATAARTACLTAALLLSLPGCGTPDRPTIEETSADTNGYVGSAGCRDCHERFYELWAPSHHGLAMQPFTAELGRETLTPLGADGAIEVGGARYTVALDVDGGRVVGTETDGTSTDYPISWALGGKNVTYLLTEMDRGRLQVLPVAYDLNAGDWFDTPGSAVRHFPDVDSEALDWRHPAYTFNTSCYGCHVSQVQTHFDLETRTYATRWQESGINCETCHGPAGEHVRVCREAPAEEPPEDLRIILTKQFDVQQTNDLCSPCHAKGSALSLDFLPGDRYFDHFDLVTLEDMDFYPDGRDLGENYTLTGWLMSPCVRTGELDCVHCHTSSGRFRQAADPDSACLPCHAERVASAETHSRHAAGKPGGRCIDCHMPPTWFARMKRHDHSMRPPAPAATTELGSPNACTTCHDDRPATWASHTVNTWHGPESQERHMQPARLVAAARNGDWARVDAMLDAVTAAGRGEIYAASLIRLLRGCPDPRTIDTFLAALDDPSPLVRARAAEALGDELAPATVSRLLEATRDDVRLVRVRAAAALSAVNPAGLEAPQRAALESASAEYLDLLVARPDDAYSHYNRGNYLLQRGNVAGAVEAYEIATVLRDDLAQPLVNLAQAYARQGRVLDAEAVLREALVLEPHLGAAHYNLGLILGEQARLREAAEFFRAALREDPELAAAAYNLGVLLAREGVIEEGLHWCGRAADLRPDEPRYAYTLAFFTASSGDTGEAIQRLEQVIERHPAHADSWLLLGSLYQRVGRTEDVTDLVRRARDNEALPAEVAGRLEAGAGP